MKDRLIVPETGTNAPHRTIARPSPANESYRILYTSNAKCGEESEPSFPDETSKYRHLAHLTLQYEKKKETTSA